MSAPINTKVKASKPCPCGCGKMLYPYDDPFPQVCRETWLKASAEDRKALLLEGATQEEYAAAHKRVMDLAQEIKGNRTDRTGWTDTEEGWRRVDGNDLQEDWE